MARVLPFKVVRTYLPFLMSRFRPIPILIIGAWILMAGILVKREYFTEDVFWPFM